MTGTGASLPSLPSGAERAGPLLSAPASASGEAIGIPHRWASPALREAYYAILRESLAVDCESPAWREAYVVAVTAIKTADHRLLTMQRATGQ